MLALAAVNVFVGLDASSLYLDEAFSWRAASAPGGEIAERVRTDEVAPPTYYVALHSWTELAGAMGRAFFGHRRRLLRSCWWGR